jgi:hypothetical protein
MSSANRPSRFFPEVAEPGIGGVIGGGGGVPIVGALSGVRGFRTITTSMTTIPNAHGGAEERNILEQAVMEAEEIPCGVLESLSSSFLPDPDGLRSRNRVLLNSLKESVGLHQFATMGSDIGIGDMQEGLDRELEGYLRNVWSGGILQVSKELDEGFRDVSKAVTGLKGWILERLERLKAKGKDGEEGEEVIEKVVLSKLNSMSGTATTTRHHLLNLARSLTVASGGGNGMTATTRLSTYNSNSTSDASATSNWVPGAGGTPSSSSLSFVQSPLSFQQVLPTASSFDAVGARVRLADEVGEPLGKKVRKGKGDPQDGKRAVAEKKARNPKKKRRVSSGKEVDVEAEADLQAEEEVGAEAEAEVEEEGEVGGDLDVKMEVDRDEDDHDDEQEVGPEGLEEMEGAVIREAAE